MCIVLVVVIPMTLLSCFFVPRLYSMIISDTIQEEQDASLRVTPLVTNVFSEVADSRKFLRGTDFYHMLFDLPVEVPMSDIASSSAAESFESAIQSIRDTTCVTDVVIYADLDLSNPLLTSNVSSSFVKPLSDVRGAHWHGIFTGSRALELYCPSFYLSQKEISLYGDCALIVPTKIYFEGSNVESYIAIYFSSVTLSEIMSSTLSSPNSVSYLVNDRQVIAVSTDYTLSSRYSVDYDEIMSSMLTSNSFEEEESAGSTFYRGYYYIEGPDWFMVNILPKEPIIEKCNGILFRFFMVCALILIFGIVLALLISRSVTNRISSVINKMGEARSGMPVPLPPPAYHDEIGNLIETYNFMTGEIDTLMQKEKDASESLRIAEFNLLQAQINPHFLYNTMDMISWLSASGRTEDVTIAVRKLSRFYRLTLSRKESLIPLSAELEHVSLYMELQNMRFNDAIDFVVDVPDELLEADIPKLSLQPVVENAIIHGIMEKEVKSGTIVITGWEENGDVVLLISDDGVGMDEETLSGILKGERTRPGTGTNIAIVNIHNRFRLFYGDNYGLSYKSEEGCGTEVSLRFPM